MNSTECVIDISSWVLYFLKSYTRAVPCMGESVCSCVCSGNVVFNYIGYDYWVEISVGRKRQNTFHEGVFETQGTKVR